MYRSPQGLQTGALRTHTFGLEDTLLFYSVNAEWFQYQVDFSAKTADANIVRSFDLVKINGRFVLEEYRK